MSIIGRTEPRKVAYIACLAILGVEWTKRSEIAALFVRICTSGLVGVAYVVKCDFDDV